MRRLSEEERKRHRELKTLQRKGVYLSDEDFKFMRGIDQFFRVSARRHSTFQIMHNIAKMSPGSYESRFR